MLKFDWNALFVLINLIVFFLLMKKFLFGRIAKVLEQRREMLDSEFKKASETNAEADKKLADYESKIAGYEAEGDKIISDARDSAKVEYEKIIQRAESDADSMKEKAREQIRIDTLNARKASREEIASLAIEAAEKVVASSVDAKTDSAIFDDFLNEGSVDE